MIYFIRNGDSNLIKVGYCSGDPMKRLQAMQTGNPHQLILIGYREGDKSMERKIHSWFKANRVRGEWFHQDGYVWDTIVSLLRGRIINKKIGSR